MKGDVSTHLNTASSMTIKHALLAEAFGTFFLVFAGTGSLVVNEVTDGCVTHVGIALTFGLVVLSLVYAIGDISGCHLNPAVTIGFVLAGRFPASNILRYFLSQFGGGLCASLLVRTLFPTHGELGGTHPSGSYLQSFVLESVLTLLLMFVILNVSHGVNKSQLATGVAVGAVIALEALFAGPISGASMNPARSIAPALVSWRWDGLWIYCTAPFVGAFLAVVMYRGLRESTGSAASTSDLEQNVLL